MDHYQYPSHYNGQFAKVPVSDYDPFLQQPTGCPAPPSTKTHQPVHLVRRKGFKPIVHKTISIALLASLMLGLIAVLEYSTRVLPQVSFNLASQVHNSSVRKRQDDGYSGGTEDPSGDDPFELEDPPTGIGTSSTDTGPDASWTTVSSQTDPGVYLGDSATTYTSPTAHQPSESYNPGASVTTVVNGDPLPAAPSPTNSGGAFSPTVALPPASYLSTGATTTALVVAPVATITSQSALTGANGMITGSTAVLATSYTSLSPSGTVVAGPIGSSSSDNPSLASKGHDEVTLDSDVPLTLINHHENYFLGVYLPVLIVVILRLFVGYFYRCMHLLDPFFALSEHGGAAFKDFFWAEHLAAQPFWSPIHACESKRWTLFSTAILYALAQVMIPFASELIAIHSSNYDFAVGDSVGYVRGSALWINITIVRIMQSVLGIMILLLAGIWLSLRGKDSGLRGSPASIATIASITNHPDVAEDFASIPQDAKKKAINQRFGMQYYQLDFFDAAYGNRLCGIVPVGEPYGVHRPSHHPSLPRYPSFSNAPAQRSPEPFPSDTPVKRSMFKGGLGSLVFMTAASGSLLGIIVAYYLNKEPTEFEHFMDSQSFGPRFVLSALGLCLKSPLIILCARFAATVPFSRLASRPRRADPDLLEPVPLTPIGVIGWALHRGEWFCAGLAVAAGIMVEILLILLPGVPFEASQLWLAALASWYGCMGCLGFIILVTLAGWCRFLFKREGWPRSPVTVGAVAMYTAGTELAAECSAERVGLDDVRSYDFGVKHGRWVVEIADHGAEESYTRNGYNRASGMSSF